MKRRTAAKKWLGAMQRMRQWIKTHRHQKLRRTLSTLKAKLQGTWNYYGLIGNHRRMQLFHDATCRTLHKWLNRRSQRQSVSWPALNRLLERFQVPRPRIVDMGYAVDDSTPNWLGGGGASGLPPTMSRYGDGSTCTAC